MPSDRSSASWAVIAPTIRAVGVFALAIVAWRHELHPCAAACITLVCAAGAQRARLRLTGGGAPTPALHKSNAVVAACAGVCLAVQVAAMVGAVVALQPYRWVVASAVEPFTVSLVAPLFYGQAHALVGVPWRRLRGPITLAVLGLVMLLFARNDTKASLEVTGLFLSAEGMALLSLYAVASLLRQRFFVCPELADDDGAEADAALEFVATRKRLAVVVDCRVAEVGALVALAASVIGYFAFDALPFSPGDSWLDAAAAIAEIAVCSVVMYVAPTLCATQMRKRAPVPPGGLGGGGAAPLVRDVHGQFNVDLAVVTVLGTTLHAIAAPSTALAAVDAALVISAAVLWAFAAYGVQRAANAVAEEAATAASLSPSALFALHDDSMTHGAFRDPQKRLATFAELFATPKQRRLGGFLCVMLTFMVLELLVGLRNNSLGLVADSFHMALDSASIFIGLVAAVVATWPPDATHPYGYGRYEILAAFANGVLLIFLGSNILCEGVHRLLHPQEIKFENLLTVSVGGLLVNCVGVAFFHDGGSHGHSHGCGHSHGSEPCGGHSHGGVDVNMRGVFLHVLADLLGSLAVIISSLVVRFTGFTASDGLCSAIVSIFIQLSSVALLHDSGAVLLQKWPDHLLPAGALEDVSLELQGIPGVTSVEQLTSWANAPGSTVEAHVCTCVLRCEAGAKEDEVRAAATGILRRCDAASTVDSLAIEVVK